ncbi:Uncharacterised protein [Klebsiella grimontii]|nr:Uncharacterised protein [Klebsiella grimontii]
MKMIMANIASHILKMGLSITFLLFIFHVPFCKEQRFFREHMDVCDFATLSLQHAGVAIRKPALID